MYFENKAILIQYIWEHKLLFDQSVSKVSAEIQLVLTAPFPNKQYWVDFNQRRNTLLNATCTRKYQRISDRYSYIKLQIHSHKELLIQVNKTGTTSVIVQ